MEAGSFEFVIVYFSTVSFRRDFRSLLPLDTAAQRYRVKHRVAGSGRGSRLIGWDISGAGRRFIGRQGSGVIRRHY